MAKFNPKIALVGSGNIGGSLALLAGLKGLSSNIVMIDIVKGLPFGKALDMSQALTTEGVSVRITASNDLGENSEALKDADVVVVTAGIPRKPGMSRDDLLTTNASIISSVGKTLKQQCPEAFVICITNPLDVMVSVLQKSSGIPANKVVGMAGVLDTARFKYFLSEELRISPRDIQAMVLGGHGDAMVPLKAFTSVGGVPMKTLLETKRITAEKLDAIVTRTRNGGGEIVELMGTSAFVAPASAAVSMVEAYLRDERRILPCCAKLNGQYGLKDVYGGVPVILGAGGVEDIVELPLDSEEKAAFEKSMQAVTELCEVCRRAGHDC